MYSISSKVNNKNRFNIFNRITRKSSEDSFNDLEMVLQQSGLLSPKESYYAKIIDKVPHLIYARDKEGKYTIANQAFADFAGKPVQTILGKTDHELQIFLNPDHVRDADQQTFESNRKKFIPLEPFTDKQGNLYWFQTIKNIITDEKGEANEVLMVSTDITKKVEVEQRLTKSEIRYRSIFENNYSGIIVVDEDLKIINKNKSFDEMLNLNHLINVNDSLVDYLSDRDKRDLVDLLNGLRTRNYESFDIEIQLTGRKGYKIDTLCFVRGLYDEAFHFTEAIMTFQDITHERKQQKEIEESELRFRTIVENATEALLLLDFDQQKYIDANFSAEVLFGYTKEEFLQLNLGDLSPEYQANAEPSRHLSYEFMARAVRGESVVYEWKVKRKDQSEIFCEVRLVKMPYPDKNIVRISIIDITERKIAEGLINAEKKKLQESNKELVDLNYMLGNQTKQLQEFAYIASHNLRSPAGNIKALLDFYREDPNEKNLGFILEKLDVVAGDLMDTINDLAEVVKIKNEVSKELTSINLNKVLDKVNESLSLVIKDRNAQINIDLGDVISIRAPKTYIDSVFLNLVSNALKYSKNDVAPIINIKAWKAPNKLMISCEDNGLGIDLARHGSKIFGLRKTFHRNKDSRGVGLFITKAQIESLGGDISVRSIPDVGSTFTIELPLSILE